MGSLKLRGVPLDSYKWLRFDDFKVRGSVARTMQREISKGNFISVLQCGGFGIRKGSPTPKPLGLIERPPLSPVREPPYIGISSLLQESLFPLLGGVERPLTNLLRDLPIEMPVYLHVLGEQQHIFRECLGEAYNFGHAINYIRQHEVQMFREDENGELYPYFTEHKHRAIKGSDGPGTFAMHFRNNIWFRVFRKVPDFCFVTDGSKFGVSLEDIVSAFNLLLQDENIKVVAFSRPITDDARKMELDRLLHGQHPRYAYARTKPCEVMEFPGQVTEDAIKTWKPLGGFYVLRLKSYLELTTAVTRRFYMHSFSTNTLYTGFSPYFKVTMALEGYHVKEGVKSDKAELKFAIYEPRHYTSSVKTEADVDTYIRLREAEAFSFRKWYAKGTMGVSR